MGISPTSPDMTVSNQGAKYPSAGSLPLIASPKYCPGDRGGGYLCESGHCCGETGCCTYYYELWWFWLLWTVLILFSCCCAYRHRRAKLRVQQQQRQREINLIAYHGACNYPTSMLDLSFLASFKLPSYEEVAAQPRTPPPPYSTVFALHGGRQYEHAGPSGLASSQSSDNYTSCSCESCSTTSPSSTSISMQATDETNTSNATTPGETDESRAPSATAVAAALASPPPPPPLPQASAPAPAAVDSPGAPGEEKAEGPAKEGGEDGPHAKPAPSPPKRALFSSNVDFFEPDVSYASEDEDLDADGSHFRHRRLTGDSGIEVCRCKVESEDEEEGAEPSGSTGPEGSREGAALIHDSADCAAGRAQVVKPEGCAALCGPAPIVQRGEESIITVESM